MLECTTKLCYWRAYRSESVRVCMQGGGRGGGGGIQVYGDVLARVHHSINAVGMTTTAPAAGFGLQRNVSGLEDPIPPAGPYKHAFS